MKQTSLIATFASILALTGVACDDDPTTPPRSDARPVDAAPGTDGSLDRTPDTADGAIDRLPDAAIDGTVDRPPDAGDAPADVPVDTTPDVAADRTPDTTVDLPPDTTPDAMADAATDATADVAAVGLNLCAVYQDRTATLSDRQIDWSLTVATDPERCMKIKAGLSVRFNGTFATHPIASAGGDTPNPIVPLSSGLTVEYRFLTPGVYGFKCTVHPSMTGAIHVVP